jgi:hypothetical protein
LQKWCPDWWGTSRGGARLGGSNALRALQREIKIF